ncbi:MAG: hypothetical protein ACR2NU_07155 [Aeoliella sp.]
MRAQHHEPERLVPPLVLVVCVVLIAFGTPARCNVDLSDPDTAVETGHQALDKSPALPWYDSAADDFRSVAVEPPPTPRPPSNFNLGEWVRVLGWLALAALLVLLVFLVTKAYLRREEIDAETWDNTQRASGDISRVEELPVALATAPGDYLNEARRLHSAGDHAQAIVYLFSHQLLQLDRRHWIRLVKGKTNRRYLRDVRRSSAAEAAQLAGIFEQTVLVFEEIFFGKRLPPQQLIDNCWRQVGTFESLVAQTAERAA